MPDVFRPVKLTGSMKRQVCGQKMSPITEEGEACNVEHIPSQLVCHSILRPGSIFRKTVKQNEKS